MAKTYTSRVYHYDDKLYRCGKLMGIITFLDGKSLKVWESSGLHKECQRIAAVKNIEVTYEMCHSDRWGDSLEKIEIVGGEVALYEAARTADEADGRSHKQGGFIAQQIKKGVQSHVEAEKKGTAA